MSSGRTDLQKFGIASGFGGLGAGLGSMFFGGGNPYDDAKGFYDQIPDILKKYLGPYSEMGMKMGGDLSSQLSGLMNDPAGMMNKFGSSYQQSPGYQFQYGQAMNAANNAAAAGGMAGTPQHQQQAAQLATNMANQDYNNYLGNVMGMYGHGLQGAQGMYNTGAQAGSSLAEMLAQSLMNQGNMAYAGTASHNQAMGDMFGNLFGGAASIASFL